MAGGFDVYGVERGVPSLSRKRPLSGGTRFPRRGVASAGCVGDVHAPWRDRAPRAFAADDRGLFPCGHRNFRRVDGRVGAAGPESCANHDESSWCGTDPRRSGWRRRGGRTCHRRPRERRPYGIPRRAGL